MDLTAQSPVEIDTRLADLYGQEQRALRTIEQAEYRVMSAAGIRCVGYGRNATWSVPVADGFAKARQRAETDQTWSGRKCGEALAAHEAAREAWEKIRGEAEALNVEFERRGGWTRAFLVTDGHVHSSMSCPTCNRGTYRTQFHWLVEFSGHTEAEVVEAAADRACTVCYPSAPVATAGPSRLLTPDEEQRKAAAEAKAEAKAAKEAGQVTVEGYRDGTRTGTHVFKTERGATNAIAGALFDLAWYGTGHPTAPEWQANVEAIRAALAAKGVEHDYDKALTAARRKVTREGGAPKF